MAQSSKRRPESARRANRTIFRRTMLLGVFGVAAFFLLFSQLYEWQITRHDELQDLAVRQQTLRTTVGASRGAIYDRNGRTLAISSTAENVCISPRQLRKDGVDLNLAARTLAEILGVDESKLRADMDVDTSYRVVKRRVEQEDADRVREFLNEQDIGNGVFFEPTAKRYYPFGSLASNVIGFTNEEGGAYGLEAVYDDEL
ncbi:MAG: stage V sporulation protein D, partial [Oscillospiraceae bacterium]|nr:stage V sporulation protein D [Oscillospiraceae bacterium]